MERTKHKKDHSGWYVAYYIRYNLPQFKYGAFKSAEDILKDKTLHCIMPGDLIVRVNSDKTMLSIKYQFSPNFKWEKLTPPVLYVNTEGTWKTINDINHLFTNGTNETQVNSTEPRRTSRVHQDKATQKRLF